jgi:hypothetical protein
LFLFPVTFKKKIATYIKILESMSKNPEGFQFHTLSTKFNEAKNKTTSKPTSQPTSRPGSQRDFPKGKTTKTPEEEEAENDLGSYANLIYGTIKNFFSGIIEIKGKKCF